MVAVLTSRAEVESIFSQVGVDLRLDDDQDGTLTPLEEDRLMDAMEDAEDTFMMYAQSRYTLDAMAVSRWARRRCSWLAANRLSRRRANPPQFVVEQEETLAELELVRNGVLAIPGAPTHSNFLPAMSNMQVDYRYVHSKLRVVQEISTGGQDSCQHSLEYWWGILAGQCTPSGVDIGIGEVTVGTFTGLTDTPEDYVGHASKTVTVKADESGLEFTIPAGGGDMLASQYDPNNSYPGRTSNDCFDLTQQVWIRPAANGVIDFEGNWRRRVDESQSPTHLVTERYTGGTWVEQSREGLSP